MNKPWVILKIAMSLDGCIDDAAEERLVLSSDPDLERVDQLRAQCDAVLVGAGTIRSDNPRLLVRSAVLQEERQEHGLSCQPFKVSLTCSGELADSAEFFQAGDGGKILYAPVQQALLLKEKLGKLATVIAAPGDRVSLEFLLEDLYQRGVCRLLVEGGRAIACQFLESGAVDQFRLAVAARIIADPQAVRLFKHPVAASHSYALEGFSRLGDTMVLNYLRNPDSQCLLRCPLSERLGKEISPPTAISDQKAPRLFGCRIAGWAQNSG